MNTYRITYTDEEGARLQGGSYNPADPSFEDVRANHYRLEGAVFAFYAHGEDDGDDLEILTVGRDAVSTVEKIDGEEGGPAQSVPADPGVAAPSPAGETMHGGAQRGGKTEPPKKKWWQT